VLVGFQDFISQEQTENFESEEMACPSVLSSLCFLLFEIFLILNSMDAFTRSLRYKCPASSFPMPRTNKPRSPWFPDGSRCLAVVAFVLTLLCMSSGQAMALYNTAPATRQGDFFRHELSGDNASGPDWMQVSVSDGTATEDGSILIPPASQEPQHDADGNLRSDGVHEFTWDAENRLVKIETLAAAVTAGVPYRRVECVYDSQWRRVRRLLFDQPSATTPLETIRYLWAGWRCLAELGATDSVRKTLVWGLDAQQSLHLGDGNGALLWTRDAASGETHYFHYDGNGNVTGLSNAAGDVTAEYLYSAFGELLERSGSYAEKNLYRFSTKPFEDVGGLYYYGYRYLQAAHGGWLSQDPLGETGGLNLHGFVGNDGLNHFDVLGLYPELSWSGASQTAQNAKYVHDVAPTLMDASNQMGLMETAASIAAGRISTLEASRDARKLWDLPGKTRKTVDCVKDAPKTIANKFPDEALPLDGKIFGEATISDGRIAIPRRQIPRDVDFIVTKNGRLLLGRKHHLLGERTDVLAAGQMKINGQGDIKRIDNLSGHYQPTVEEGLKFPMILQNLGINVSGARLQLYRIESTAGGMVRNIVLSVNQTLP
jgi:RHS repeat-associated protein